MSPKDSNTAINCESAIIVIWVSNPPPASKCICSFVIYKKINLFEILRGREEEVVKDFQSTNSLPTRLQQLELVKAEAGASTPSQQRWQGPRLPKLAHYMSCPVCIPVGCQNYKWNQDSNSSIQFPDVAIKRS